MTRKEFEQVQEELQRKIGRWQICIGDEEMGEFIIGCFFDENVEQWKVYINNERGRHRIRLQTLREDEAFEELLSMINFEIENNKYM